MAEQQPDAAAAAVARRDEHAAAAASAAGSASASEPAPGPAPAHVSEVPCPSAASHKDQTGSYTAPIVPVPEETGRSDEDTEAARPHAGGKEPLPADCKEEKQASEAATAAPTPASASVPSLSTTPAAAPASVPAASAARASAYSDASLDRRTRGTISLARRRKKPRVQQQLDPKLQRMLDSYAAAEAAAAEAAAARAARSHAALSQTHRQVIHEGRMSWRPMTERERMQHVLSAHVGGAAYEHTDEEAGVSGMDIDAAPTSAAPSSQHSAAFQLLLDSTAPVAAPPAALETAAAAAPFHSADVRAHVLMHVTSDGTVELRVEPALSDATAQQAPAADDAIAASPIDPSAFHAFVDIDVGPDGHEVVTRIHLMSVQELEALRRRNHEGEDSDDDAEASLVDLMEADADLEMHGGGQVHTLDAFRAEQEAARAAVKNPPPSLLQLVQHYAAEQLDRNPIGAMIYLASFDWPPDALLQWMMLLPRISRLWSQRHAEAEARDAAEQRARGNVYGVKLSSNVGRFRRDAASVSVRAHSSATLPRNVVTLDQWDVDLKASDSLPKDYVPKGLDDILRMSLRYGFEPVGVLLEQLGHSAEEVEVMHCYVIVMQEIVQQERGIQQQSDVAGAGAGAGATAGAAASAASPSHSRVPSSLRTVSTPRSGGIATLASLREGGAATAAAATAASPPKPPMRHWGSGHSLVTTPPAEAGAASGGAAPAPSAAPPVQLQSPHPDPQSLVPIDPSEPCTKVQLSLHGQARPLVLSLHLSHTLADLRRAVAAASGVPADRFELSLQRPRQTLTGDNRTIAQLKLQSAKIAQTLL